MNIYNEPTYTQLINFTDGKWDSIETIEERKRVYDDCIRDLERRRLEWQWKRRLCPPLYQNTIPEQLPNPEKFDEVQKWQYGPMGLLLVGPSRSGKTRAAWALMKRLHFDEQRAIIAFNPMDLKLEVATQWRDPKTAESWTWRLRNIDVLFLDDLDTIKFTEAVEETIYDIFESRPTHGKPVIVTLNLTGQELAKRMNAYDRGAKIVERMRETCHVVNFA